MPFEVQLKLQENIIYKKYLRYHSYWYKLLIRNPKLISEFINETKAFYQLRPADKINKAITTINMISNIFNNML